MSEFKALDGEMMFDGSSIEGFVRIEESDMYLVPHSISVLNRSSSSSSLMKRGQPTTKSLLNQTFMPKPLFGLNGNGMHFNVSLFKGEKNAFYDENDEIGLSQDMRYFMAGILKHARGFTAVCNPLVNSYKRLVPGYEAPSYIAWSGKNRSPLMRIPSSRGMSTRAEVRSVDPSANPYLALV